MQGRSAFTPDEITELRRLIREKQTADRDRQKALRGRMRRIGFYISDFAADYSGFVVSDLDELISRGTISVKGGDIESAPHGSPSISGFLRTASGDSLEAQAGDALASYVRDAMATLGHGNALPLTAAVGAVPDRPGLYAIHASPQTWRELGLGDPPDGRPLYVGKAEDSLVTRDLKTHFGDGRTGHSTVRRSFAALCTTRLSCAESRGTPPSRATSRATVSPPNTTVH